MDAIFHYRGYDIPTDLLLMTGGGPDSFGTISEWHQNLLKQWIDIQPTDDVLEIGCGIGRDAIPLSEYLTEGSYIGVDIIERSIAFCRNTIGARHPNFRFDHFDVQDDLHNPGGTGRTTAIRLDLEDQSIDKIFLFSVFTHLFRHDIVHYLKEFRRVLKLGGKVYATTFIYDDAILDRARVTNLTPFDLRFEHEAGIGCRINDPRAPLGAVAYTRQAWDEMVTESELGYAGPFLRGAWSGFYAEPQEGQDVALLVKR